MTKLTYRGFEVPEGYVTINGSGFAWMDGVDTVLSNGAVTTEKLEYDYFRSTLAGGSYWRYPKGAEDGQFHPGGAYDDWRRSYTSRTFMQRAQTTYPGEYEQVNEEDVPAFLAN